MKQLSIRSLVLALLVCCMAAITASAQVSRSRNKVSNPYRSNYQRMAAGYDAECSFEIRNGALWAVGHNTYGQLGDGTTITRYAPVQVGSATNWVSITGGDHFTMGITSDGKLWGWGYNAGGQLGDGTTIDKLVPTQIGSASNWVCVAAGGLTTAAVSADGKLWAWGNNQYGQLGDGTTNNRTVPVQVGSASNWVNVVCGRGAILALSADGKIWGCGRNSAGHLGDGTFTNKSFFTAIPGTTRWSSLSSGPYHALAISADGKLYAWGNNFIGQLGDGTLVNKNTPTLIGGIATWVCALAGVQHGLAIKTDGTLWGWGDNSTGALGDGTTTNQTVPVQAGSATNWVDVSAGSEHSLGLTADGNLWAWGYGAYGELGTGTGSDQHSPVKTQGALSQWLCLTGGISFEAMIKGDGTLWTVGRNNYGQLGDGSGGSFSNSKMIPVQAGVGNSWVCTAAGLYHCLAIKADGTLWAWGNGGYGALGYGGSSDQKNPIQVGTDNKWVGISCGETHTAALKNDGTIWCWGYNYGYGNNGNGTNTNNYTPVQSGTDNDWVSVAVGRYTTYAIKANGTMWAWGRNYSGQVGDNTTTDQWSPVQVGLYSNWISVSGSSDHVVALQADGTLWAWGANYNSILGDGTSTDRHVPTQLGASHNWLRVSTTVQSAKAIDASGTLWAWGDNTYGQLGDGTFTTRTTPTLISGQSDVVGFMFSTPETVTPGILKVARDKICLTGYNAYGELADGTTTTSNTFNCGNNVCAAYTYTGISNYVQPLGGTGSRIDIQSSCGLAAEITPTNTALASGSVTVKVWVEPGIPTYTGTPYLARHLEITPAANSGTASGTITLYCSQAEFTAYNAAPNHGPNMPVDAADAANNKANIRITKKSGVSSDGSGLPGTYGGTNTVIIPGSVVWNASISRWVVTFSTTGFSGFFINTSSNPLPVRLIAFTAMPAANTVQLAWEVADQKDIAAYIVQRSASGSNFTDLTSLPPGSRTYYSAIDAAPFQGRSYYRLKMQGLDGACTYSNTESVIMNDGSVYFTLSPQPAGPSLTIVTNDAALNGSTATLTDMQGRTLQSFVLHTGEQRISLDGLQSGVYLLRLLNGRSWKVIKE